MTLDQLRYFRAVCQYDSVIQAAKTLNISQPSVSNAIANLEKEFNVELFSRRRKRLFKTKECLQLLQMAENVLSQADELSRSMRELGSQNKILNLGVPPMIGSLILPDLYGKYLCNHTNLRVHTVEAASRTLLQLLAEKEIDMAFLPHTKSFDNHLHSQPVKTLQNVCCVSTAHPLASRKSISLAELCNEPLVLFKDSFFQTQRILEEFTRLAITPNILLSTSQLSTVQNMISNNTAIGFLFDFLPKAATNMVGIPLDPPMLTQISLAWNANSPVSSNMNILIQYAKEYAGRSEMCSV